MRQIMYMAKQVVEVHPFEAFVPAGMTCLIVGSFPGKDQTEQERSESEWFYGAPRNQFWKILEFVYNRSLQNRQEKQALFTEAGIGITDLIRSCVRTSGTSQDEQLQIIEDNREVIAHILEGIKPKVLFTSRFVEKLFRKLFPEYSNTDILPSPSPRFFRITLQQKADIYRQKLPGIDGKT